VTCQHPAGNAGVLCRAGSGDLCDPDEVCTGTSASCPADVFKLSSFVCRDAAGECDVTAKCPGTAGGACPADAKQPGGTACTADSYPRSLHDARPVYVTCQHPAGNAGVLCRAGSGDVCDPDELCTGTSASCPADVFKLSSFVCRDAA